MTTQRECFTIVFECKTDEINVFTGLSVLDKNPEFEAKRIIEYLVGTKPVDRCNIIYYRECEDTHCFSKCESIRDEDH